MFSIISNNDLGSDDISSYGSSCSNAINSLGKSVADGKALIASAITTKGVSTDSNDTFSTMATNIGNIKAATSHNITATYNESASTSLGYGPTIMIYVDGNLVTASMIKGTSGSTSTTI